MTELISRRGARLSALLVVAGAAAFAHGVVDQPERAWLNLLVDSFYLLSLGVSAIFFLATQRLSGARWSAGLRRIPEAMMLTLPVAAALVGLLALFGRESVYSWSVGAPDTHPAGGKLTYLEPGFVLARMAAVVAIWIGFAWRIRQVSLAQDADPDRRHDDPGRALDGHVRLNRLAGAFAPVFAVTFTVAAHDWLISLEPEWFSTMFAVYVFAGAFVQGIAAVTLATVLLARRGLLGRVGGEKQLHDLGKMLFAFTTFWAYIWVCQYLLIWYGNVPEEVTYYMRRTGGEWLPLFLATLVVNWVIPFAVLLPVRAKRNGRVLAALSGLLLAGHWLDLYVMVMPARWSAPRLGLVEILTAGGCAALFYLVFVRALTRAPLVPTNDPVLADHPPRGGAS